LIAKLKRRVSNKRLRQHKYLCVGHAHTKTPIIVWAVLECWN